MSRILLVEDDLRLSENLKFNLELRGMNVISAHSLTLAREALTLQSFDGCLLDIELPDGDGLDFCDLLRTNYPELPILLVSARHDEKTIVKGLTVGADDYIRKPFMIKELALRLTKIILKQRRGTHISRHGDLILDLDRRLASYRDRQLNLARREFDLLRVFVNYPERIYTRSHLVDAIGGEELIQERTIDSHVSHLRSKLKAVGCLSLKIVSVYGSGYQAQIKVCDS